MDKPKSLIGLALLMALIVGGAVLLYLRGREPRAEVQLPGGGVAEVTPLEKMRVRTAEPYEELDLSSYRLTVTGLVRDPLSLTFEDIRALDTQEKLVDLPCVEGWTETALWKGPRLLDLLDKAGVLEEADNVIFSSPGGYTTSLTLADIEETDPLLAYEVNGEQLPREQGFPLRLVVPNRLGYKWIKWVTAIEVIAGDYEGFWERRGYPNSAYTSDR
jgi:DMSO/TMAO reductase YedYZ molybdopterin-dependent catalytic subunit